MDKSRHILVGIVLGILIYNKTSIYYMVPISMMLLLFFISSPGRSYIVLGLLLIIPSLFITDTPEPLPIGEHIEITGKIVKKYAKYPNYQRIVIKSSDRKISVTTDGSLEVDSGDIVKINLVTTDYRGYKNFGLKTNVDYNWINYVSDYGKLEGYNLVSKGSYLSQLKNKIVSNIEDRLDNLSEENRGIVGRLIIGTSSEMDPDLRDKFSALGLSHLLAISGLHIGVLILAVETVLKRFKTSYYIRVFVLASFTFLYAYILDFSPSVTRVLTMYIVSVVVESLKIKIETIDVVIISLIISLVINPRGLYDVGLQLSYGATLGLIMFYNRLRISNHWLTKSIVGYFSVHLILLPIIIKYFNNYNLIGLIANIVIAPVFIALIPMSMVSILLNNRLVYYLLDLVVDSTRYYIDLLSKVDLKVTIANPTIWMMVFFYMMIFIFTNRDYREYLKTVYEDIVLLLCSLIIVTISIPKDPIYIGFYDVGQGDSAYIYYRDTYVQIDTGGSTFGSTNPGEVVTTRAIENRGLRVDLLLLSHFDSDHVMGTPSLLEKNLVDLVGINYFDYDNKVCSLVVNSGVRYKKLSRDDRVGIGNMGLDFYNTNPPESHDPNDKSSVVLLRYKDKKILFTGDAGSVIEDNLAEEIGPIDILKVSHHGSSTGSSEYFVSTIKPRHSVVSVGDNNYGHPTKEVLSNLYSAGSKIYRTDRDGEIVFRIDNDLKVVRAVDSYKEFVSNVEYINAIIVGSLLAIIIGRNKVDISRI